jgi:hypothetical protein
MGQKRQILVWNCGIVPGLGLTETHRSLWNVANNDLERHC